ncbi:MAG: fatty acid oxidation complex subunit alpha FadJ, partial [Polyangiaceae bacterium]|nr:fatty acid oxidation complex subunit alpha FadJ [Polyangiaceae bacterium]
FPVGPLKLTDEVGIDVGAKVGSVLYDAFGERFAPPRAMAKIHDDGRKGRKNEKGFYLYGAKRKGVDASIYDLIGVTADSARVPRAEIQWRCVLRLVNEACHCFGDGILRSARDGDLGAVFGLGFPPFRGGPFRFVDHVGAREVVRRLEVLHAKHGPRFAPAPILVAMAKDGTSFHGPRAVKPSEASPATAQKSRTARA